MHEEAIDKKTRTALGALVAKGGLLKDFYLAGGTALALDLEHRISFDLDFFSRKNFNVELLAAKLGEINGYKLEKIDEGTVLGYLNGVKVEFFHYPYPLLSPLKKSLGVSVSSVADIACMKIIAICQRGTKRDFIDLYFILQEKLTLRSLFQKYNRKYGKLAVNRIHIVKSLRYFSDAESETMPRMLKKVEWKKVKKFLADETEMYFKNNLK